MKFCTTCKCDKLHTDFYKSKAAKDGYQAKCKKCALDYEREQRKIPATRIKRNAYGVVYQRDYRKKHPEKRGLRAATMKRWCDAHREHYRKYQAEYHRSYGKKAIS
jgi:hypothetical protein